MAVTAVGRCRAAHEATGWIDSQSKSIDERWYWRRFTPRRARSMWSKRNRDILGSLIEEGRMQPDTRAKPLATFIEMLREGRKLYVHR